MPVWRGGALELLRWHQQGCHLSLVRVRWLPVRDGAGVWPSSGHRLSVVRRAAVAGALAAVGEGAGLAVRAHAPVQRPAGAAQGSPGQGSSRWEGWTPAGWSGGAFRGRRSSWLTSRRPGREVEGPSRSTPASFPGCLSRAHVSRCPPCNHHRLLAALLCTWLLFTAPSQARSFPRLLTHVRRLNATFLEPTGHGLSLTGMRPRASPAGRASTCATNTGSTKPNGGTVHLPRRRGQPASRQRRGGRSPLGLAFLGLRFASGELGPLALALAVINRVCYDAAAP